MEETKSSVALLWSTLDKLITNGIALVISIILARIVDPENYGVIATASIFTILLSIFVEPGMTSALIRKKDSDRLDFSTILMFNVVFGMLLYLLLFLLSNPISIWYELPELSNVLKVLGIQILIGSVNSVQLAYVQKNMYFKKYFFVSLISTSVSAVVGIVMAYQGFGVWALVAYTLVRPFINAFLTLIVFKCFFGIRFSLQRFKVMFPFAGSILLAKLADQGYVEVTQTIISKVYSPTDLALHNKGKSFPDLIVNNLNQALSSVFYPYFSKQQDELDVLKESLRLAVKMISFVCVPMMIGLIACSESFVLAVLTDKWIRSIPFLVLCCIYNLWVPFSSVIQQSLKATGKGAVVLKLGILKISLCAAFLVIFLIVLKSPISIALSLSVAYTICFFVEWGVASKHLSYKVREIMVDFLPSFAISCVMGLCVFLVGMIDVHVVWKLVIQVVVGVFAYAFLAFAFKFPQIKIMKTMIKSRRDKKTDV